MDSFRNRLKQAAVDGVLVGVKYAIVGGMIVALSWGIVQDYLTTKLAAQQGAAAFAYLREQIQKAQPK